MNTTTYLDEVDELVGLLELLSARISTPLVNECFELFKRAYLVGLVLLESDDLEVVSILQSGKGSEHLRACRHRRGKGAKYHESAVHPCRGDS